MKGRSRLPAPNAGPWPTAFHWASIVGALGFWAWVDRKLWFFGDEWDFVVNRSVFTSPSSAHGVWFPHNEHWSTLPVLLWRGLYNIFHLGSYWPYLMALFIAAAGVMHLTWRLCLSSGSGPWLASLAVAVLGFLGAGAEDLAWAFQIGFVGSVLFGLVAWQLLSGGAPRAATDMGASVALLASLMCSTIGDSMLVGAAVIVLAQGPRSRAFRVLALPLASYVLWFATIGHRGLTSPTDAMSWTTFRALPGFVWAGFSKSLGATFNVSGAGAFIFVPLAAWCLWNIPRFWKAQPTLVAAAAASFTFFLLAGTGRDALGDAIPSRYVYVCIALLIPLITRLLTSVTGPAAVMALCVCLLGVTFIGNIGQAHRWESARDNLVVPLKAQVLAASRLLAGGATDVGGPLAHPIPYEPDLDPVDLRSLAQSHVLPEPPLSTTEMVNARTLLSTGLSATPLSRGRFVLAGTVSGTRRPAAPGCTAFRPKLPGQAMQLRLDVLPPAKVASLRVVASPAPSGQTEYLAAVLAPPGRPSSTIAAELPLPPNGTAYLNYNDPGTELVLFWSGEKVVSLCGLAAK